MQKKQLIEKLKSLKDYHILKEGKDYAILGKKITIKVHKEMLGNVFQPFSKNVTKQVPIFFLLTEDNSIPIAKNFKENKLPMLILGKEPCNHQQLSQLLHQFSNSISE